MCESEIDDGWTELLEVRRARKRVMSAVLAVVFHSGWEEWFLVGFKEEDGGRMQTEGVSTVKADNG